MFKHGSLLAEALVALLIISFAMSIALVSSWNLMKISQESQAKMDLSELLFNTCEEIVHKELSSIQFGQENKEYKGETYSISVTKNPENIGQKFSPSSNSANLVAATITSVTIRVQAKNGNFVEAVVIPIQW
ncbi:MAG TPA: hypothetical protein PLD16_07265 [Fervidobacterium sp.]|nr:hypothetical protein [Fervidobacterium sp.]